MIPPRRLLFVLAVFAVLLVLSLPLAAQEKTLHWADFAVRARLDADGALHVAERQTLVFTGDWNGGYRQFRLGIGQNVELERLLRLADNGQAVPLVAGDVDHVDHYAWADSSTLRWRSRLPSDPPFAETRLIYEIDYTLTGIVWQSGGLYHLNHDFAFPDREGEIERFSLDLDLDPVWQPVTPVAAHFEARNLPPGQSFVIERDLDRRLGAGTPAGIRSAAPAALRAAFFLASLLAIAWLYFRLRAHEAALGRFDPPRVPATPDPAWLEENVLSYLPEEVGALWDRKIGPPEVAATLARLVAEGKLESEVVPARTLLGFVRLGNDVLRLRRVAPLEELVNHEKKLVDALFFGGRTEVSTDEIRAHYKSRGFDPAQVIREDLEKSLRRHAEVRGTTLPPPRKPTLFLALAVAALFLLGAPLLALVVCALALLLYVPGLIAAFRWRQRTERLDLASLSFLLPGLGVFALCLGIAFFPELLPHAGGFVLPGVFASLALALLPVLAMNSLLNNARSRETAETIRRRQILGVARRWLARELRRPSPALRDEWYPYLLAFGLSSQVDRWFRSFGAPAAASRTYAGSASSFGGSGSGGSGGSGGGGWTGGGGAFGGAGASATWAAAATGLAAGVSAPSSSGSGGGGGGGGGGSSGGGGGGGW
jgi:uncharacterized membrane protein YgcG